MAQTQPTPPVEGGVGNTGWTACVSQNLTARLVQRQVLTGRHGISPKLSDLLGEMIWEVRNG